MIYIPTVGYDRARAGSDGIASRVHTLVDSIIGRFKPAAGLVEIAVENDRTLSEKTDRERRLQDFQVFVSQFSMHLPKGLAAGMNAQFANMFASDVWEDQDELPALVALMSLLLFLKETGTQNRPGIGTNGRGSITAFWRAGSNRLTVDFLQSGEARWVTTRENDRGDLERAAGECQPDRLVEMLQPFRPEVWFG